MNSRHRHIPGMLLAILLMSALAVTFVGWKTTAAGELSPQATPTPLPTRAVKPAVAPTSTPTPVPAFKMDIDATVCARGYGPVVFGTVQEGSVALGQVLTITRNGIPVDETTVDAVQTFWQQQPVAAGQTVGLLLRQAPSLAATMKLDDGDTALAARPGIKPVPTLVAAKRPFRMTVDGASSIPGRGTVIRGLVDSGLLQPPQDVVILRAGKPALSTTVTGLERPGARQEEAAVCDQVGMLVRGVSSDEVRPGDILAVQAAPTAESSAQSFRMTVAGVFSIPGRGTVVTGKVESGTLELMDVIEIIQSGRLPIRTTVTGIENTRKAQGDTTAGDTVYVLLRGVNSDDITKGAMIVAVSD